ncbi:unnamed protein product, partial [marine sediment metagenome]
MKQQNNTVISISEIKSRRRHRKDLGDIESLAQSIDERGLLQPIAIDEDNRLIAGRRRIAAFKHLGRDEIPVFRINNFKELVEYLKAERDENVCRKEFALTEIVALGRDLESYERKEAKKRMMSGKP